jgi:hypothetical protein
MLSQATDSLSPSPALPASPRAIAQSVGSGFMPVIYRPDGKTEAQRFERLPHKTKLTPEAALRHAERVIYFSQLRTNEAKRRFAATSDPWWVGGARLHEPQADGCSSAGQPGSHCVRWVEVRGGPAVTLYIHINGRQRFAAPYNPANVRDVADALNEQLPTLRRFGRVAVFVNDDSNVAHIIVAR